MYKSSIGIDSSDFRLNMFDVEEIFGGSVDKGRISMEQMALINYQDGRYTFAMTPTGIRISTESDEILPSELLEATLFIVRQIDQIRTESEIEIDEFDFQTAFALTRDNGIELANRFSNTSIVNEIVEVPPSEVRIRVLYEQAPFRYSMSISPIASDEDDESQNLRISMLGMLNVEEEAAVEDSFNLQSTFVQHVEGIKERIDRALA